MNFYARAEVPPAIEDAMQFAIEEFELELPLAELFFANSAVELLKDQDELLYLTDKSRIRGEDCHQIAIRGPNADVQLWVKEGDQPTVRKMSMSMKWDGGAPRSTAFLEWASVKKFNSKTFEFKPPEDALEIQFFGAE